MLVAAELAPDRSGEQFGDNMMHHRHYWGVHLQSQVYSATLTLCYHLTYFWDFALPTQRVPGSRGLMLPTGHDSL